MIKYINLINIKQMKRKIYLLMIITLSLPGISSLQAQDTKGTDFWVTFGENYNNPPSYVTLQIRFVGISGTTIELWFKDLNTFQNLTIPTEGVLTYSLTEFEKSATYCQTNGKSGKSLHITASYPITAYAFNSMTYSGSCDATNLLPVPTWGSDYYYLGYAAENCYGAVGRDAYAVIAIEDDTEVYQDGTLRSTLNTGEVYYYLENNDINLTGIRLTTNKPAALFSETRIACVVGDSGDNLFQQLASVNTWGKTFLVPKLAKNTKDRVRIVACQSGTTITQFGGTLISGSYTLNAGQWLELELALGSSGCYIEADKPVGVGQYINTDPSLAWVPALDQNINTALVAPFSAENASWLNSHNGLIITPSSAKNNTTVSIAGGDPQPLSGGTWVDNTVSGYSYYDITFTNIDVSYNYENKDGLIVFGYGFSAPNAGASYHYVASSGVRELIAAFYANEIHYKDLENTPICENMVEFRADIDGMGMNVDSIIWYINGVPEPSAQNQQNWSKTFSQGEYEIKMWVRFDNGYTINRTGTLKRKDLWIKMRNIKH